jgi:DNA polymerase I-like protein with 3'-5' exonuclease and polymerase domains
VDLITLDFETYYAQDYSLTKLTTEEYIRDKRFEVIGVGVKVGEDKTEWFSGSHIEIQKYLSTLPWNDSALLCHNTMFDGAILAWRFGIKPSLYLDTLCMGRAVHGVDVGGSLASLVEQYKLGAKGTEVIEAKGKQITGFTSSELARYGEYCKNDVELTFKLFQVLSSAFPKEELQLIDLTLRMFIHPVLEVDDALLVQRLDELKHEKLQLLGTLKEKLECENEEAVRKKLASNKQFAELLQTFNVPAPMKESKTTGKDTYALAKNDEGFIALTEHEDPFIQQLCAVRLGTKSTIEESRIERFIDVGSRNKGRLPIPLKYYGAHTGRWAGSDKVNFQNLPSRDVKKKTLKNAVVAPEDYVVINCDSSQIEARVLAWLAGQDDVVEQFAKGEDVYSIFATSVYERPISKKDPIERFVGKTCILGLGYGTGALKLQHTLKTTPPGVVIDETESKRIVDLYREKNAKIISLWKKADKAIGDIANWEDTKPYYLGKHRCLTVTKEGIKLPNGLYIRYPSLELNPEKANSGYIYQSRKGPVSLWGGSVVENVVQALARIIVGQQMIKLTERYRPVLTVHDAAVCVVPEDEVDEACAWIVEVMSKPPEWAKGLPVACEAHYGQNYGEMEEWRR